MTTSACDADVHAIAFDLDGTLVDSAPDIGHALNGALHESGLQGFALDRVHAWIGDGPDPLIARALAALGQGEAPSALRATLRAAFDRATLAAPLTHGTVFEGIDALLQQLQPNWPMVVADICFLNSSKLPKESLIASATLPPGAPPPPGFRLFQ